MGTARPTFASAYTLIEEATRMLNQANQILQDLHEHPQQQRLVNDLALRATAVNGAING